MKLRTGEHVHFPPTAVIARPFAVGGKFARLLAEEVGQIAAFAPGEDPITTVDLPAGQLLRTHVVELLDEEMPRWAINSRHKAKEPQPSPFIELTQDDGRLMVDHFTFEMIRQGGRYLITQAYPGDYVPPLPWMASASKADGGKKACREFWDEHAFVTSTQRHGDLTDEVPDWALAH